MRLADAILRRGHLSQQALAEVYLTGARPAHLDRCDICAARAVDLSRWLDDIRAVGVDEADATLPPERLAAQQAQILRRLEHLDRPARVIAFPGHPGDRLDIGSHGIRPAWVGIAAAAGLILGLLGGQLSARLGAPHTPARPPAQVLQTETPGTVTPSEAVWTIPDLDEYDRPQIAAVEALDHYTPHSLTNSREVVLRTNRTIR